METQKSQSSRAPEDSNMLNAEEIAKLTRAVFRKYKVQKAILFGSFARGRQTRKSDVDLILIRDSKDPYFKRFEGILPDLYEKIPGRDIEVFIYTPEELARIGHRSFIKRALEQGKVIYESG
jgi:predicted nucleotidyltransferase